MNRSVTTVMIAIIIVVCLVLGFLIAFSVVALAHDSDYEGHGSDGTLWTTSYLGETTCKHKHTEGRDWWHPHHFHQYVHFAPWGEIHYRMKRVDWTHNWSLDGMDRCG